MGFRHRIKTVALTKIGKSRYIKIIEKEETIKQKYKCISSTLESPVRFDIPLEAIDYIIAGKATRFFRFKILPVMVGSIRGIQRGLKDIKNNPSSPKTKILDTELQK